ncbi:MAG: S41 family peptidase [Deltaproteobacteria bacterium]|nr:S41 family peptidase [Deltaproteobacteria bacterium]
MRKRFITTTLLLAVFITFFVSDLTAKRFVPESDLIYKVLNYVSKGYVDQKRVKPDKMLEGALEKLSSSIAQVLTKISYEKGDVLIEISVDKFTQNFRFKKPKGVGELNIILQKIGLFTKKHLEEDEKPKNVDYALINGFLQKLDPHSLLLVPEAYSDFSTTTSGNFGGVGMMIGLRDGQLTIIAPIDDTPASRANLKSDDKIIQIDDESTVNMSLTDAVNKLRGEVNTKVEIFIMRKGFTSAKKFVIKRALIKIKSVESHQFKLKNKRVGYLKIKTFQKNTYTEIKDQLEELDYDLKDFSGLIVDLRNNPGGLLDQAIKISDLFLDSGVIVSTAGVSSHFSKQFKANWFRSIVDIPMVVLVNQGSASASEIVTAALKKNKRAVVIGRQTFGKGSVQQVIPLDGGSALKLTTSKYLTPGKISIQSVGVTPNIVVEPYYISSDYLKITPNGDNHNEDSLDQNFAEWGDKAEQAEKRVFYLFEDKSDKVAQSEHEDEPEDFKVDKLEQLQKDFLVQSALQVLINNKKRNYDNLLRTTHLFFEKEQKNQESKLVKKFTEFKTDWNAFKFDKPGKIQSKSWIEIKKIKGKKEVWEKHLGAIPADSDIRLYLQAKNISKQGISRLMAVSKSDSHLFDDRQFAFGKIGPGETKEWFVPINISKSILSRNDLISFEFTDQDERKVHKAYSELSVSELKRPHFAYEISVFENGKHLSSGNGNQKLEVDETVSVKVKLTNNGLGESGPVTVLLKNGEGNNVFLKKGRVNIKSIGSQKNGSAVFQFILKDFPADGDLDFSLDVIDGTFPFTSVNQTFKIPYKSKVKKIDNQSPVITLKDQLHTYSNKKYPIKGFITDQKGVKDVFIFNNKKKIFYQNYLAMDARKRVDFDFLMDLDGEYNQIVVVSRDDENVSSQKMFYIRYSGSK